MPAEASLNLLYAYAGLCTLATLIIYVGSHASLKTPPKPPGKRSIIPNENEDDDDKEEEEEFIDGELAMIYPFLASGMLLLIWVAIKYLDEATMDLVARIGFGLGGVLSTSSTLTMAVRWVLGPKFMALLPKYTLLLARGPRELFELKFSLTSLLLFPVACYPALAYGLNVPFDFQRFALYGSLLAVCFGINGLKILKLDTFRTGALFLGALFLYDIFWVFGTSVMLDVAVSLRAPIKLLWPKNTRMSRPRDFVLLGLGDVVVPGAFISHGLRYDWARFLASKPSYPSLRSFSKPYFWTTLIAYFGALASTMAIMHYTGRAQPALLYLSPACILSFALVASIRGEFKEAWTWTEVPEEKKLDVDSLPEAQPIVNLNGSAQTSAPDLAPPASTTSADVTSVTAGSEGEGSTSSRQRVRTRQQTTKGRA